jgi:hypothetical protein
VRARRCASRPGVGAVVRCCRSAQHTSMCNGRRALVRHALVITAAHASRAAPRTASRSTCWTGCSSSQQSPTARRRSARSWTSGALVYLRVCVYFFLGGGGGRRTRVCACGMRVRVLGVMQRVACGLPQGRHALRHRVLPDARRTHASHASHTSHTQVRGGGH